MIKILESQDLMESMRSMQTRYATLSKNAVELESFYPVIDEVETWRFSTGPIFDEPPFVSEMAGFDGGRILKKSYSDIYEARLKGVYSSGFIQGDHVVTVSPSKPISSPLMTKFFRRESSAVEIYSINYYNNESFQSKKAPSLIGMGRLYEIDEVTKASIVVGSGAAYSITLYYYDSGKKVTAASMVTAPIDFQFDYKMHYDGDGALELIDSGGVVWKRK